ncbi:MAG: PAC2 family protein [Spirochaetaceae bacterium]|nr:PAC2 family protein [Myxococcales bacterium]MCB9724352.1 PAC2 family protein [Spirochaetaceae bacterium]HPG28514.1 PAC2 family protein [Myxococcota bacterium]
MHVRPILGEPTLVLAFEGWNDACESASSAIHFINETVRGAPLADIDPDDYYDFTVRRPHVKYVNGRSGRIAWPSNEFRYGVSEDGLELITGLGVEPHMRWRSYCDSVVELVVDMGVQRCLLLGAYLADVVYSQPVVVTGFSTDDSLLEQFQIGPTSYEGPTGIVGALFEALREEGVEAIALWAGLPHYISATPNPRGTLALLRKASQYLEIPFELDKMRADALRFEEEISRVVAGDEELSEYVKELKRREFAQ